MYQSQPIIQNELWSNGPTAGGFFSFPGNSQGNSRTDDVLKAYGLYGSERKIGPVTTGTSVLGIKFNGGVMIAADNLVSYGSLARYQNVSRVFKINEKTILGTGGDFADFQSIKRTIDQKIIQDLSCQDDIDTRPSALYNWLTRVFYNRRCRFNPLYLDMIVGGLDEGTPFLGHVDLRGRAYEDDVVSSGFGKHLALPIVREIIGTKDIKTLTRDEAWTALRKCMEVFYYRDCRAMSKYSVAVTTKEGSVLEGPFEVNENWNVATMVKGYN